MSQSASPGSSDAAEISVSVSRDRCEGCALCEDLAPEVFDFTEAPPVVVVMTTIPAGLGDLRERVYEAQTLCPTGAVTVEPEGG